MSLFIPNSAVCSAQKFNQPASRAAQEQTVRHDHENHAAARDRRQRMTRQVVARQPGAPASTGFIVEEMASVLEVSDLAIRFGSTTVFRGLSFAVPAGSSLAVIGPNGSGKTVLFKALVGSIPYDGSVRWAPDVRIGYVP